MYFSVKGKLGIGKKGPGGAKGVEYDAMGSKWNKAMWDNMESKYYNNRLYMSILIFSIPNVGVHRRKVIVVCEVRHDA